MLTLIGMLTLIVCASMFTSCTQDEYLPETNQTEDFQADDQTIPETRAMTWSDYVFDDVIEEHGQLDSLGTLAYFQHWCQLNNNQGATNYCVPTSYMMTVGCLLKAYNDPDQFTLSKNKLSWFAQVGVSGAPAYDNLGSFSHITSQYSNIDIGLEYTNQRSYAKYWMEYYLDQGYFVIVAAQTRISRANNDMYFSKYRSVNNDLLFSTPTISSNYILDNGTTGGTNHSFIILRIDKFYNGNGVVTYIDPYNTTRSGSNRKYCLYSHLMDSMNFDGVSGVTYDYTFAYVGYDNWMLLLSTISWIQLTGQ